MVSQPNNEIYKSVVVVWLTLSIASVVLAAVTWQQLSDKLTATRQAVAAKESLDGIVKLLLHYESSQRGYTITGDAKFLEPSLADKETLTQHFEKLADLVRQDPVILKRVIELRGQAELSLNQNRQIIETRATNGFSAAAKIEAGGEGRLIMDSIRTRVAEIRAMQSDLLSEGANVARSQLFRASLTSLVAGILGVGAGVIALWLSSLTLRHRERERELVEAKLRAERSSQEKTVFLANMSHEIRTPMNAILGFSELLDHDVKHPKQREYLKSIRSSANSLLQLINDILDMSKIEAGALQLRPEPTDPREIAAFVQTVFAESAAKKGIRVESQVAEDLPQALLIDRVRLRQILVNLVGNAVKFTDRGTIRLRFLGERQSASSRIDLHIEVQDTGVGIPPDRLEVIFDPFVQAGAYQDKERQGSGLGLSIVKRLTETMGGSVAATSALGYGSVFSLRFPDVTISARLPVSEQSRPAPDEANFDALRSATVLVADDNETNCQLVAGMFAGSHHRLYFAANGQEAISKARELKPDVILLDIRMPVMGGREALAKIRRISGLELVPVIAVTASSLIGEGDGSGDQFSGYVRKPFTKQDLFDELAQFLPRQAQSNSNGNSAAITDADADSASVVTATAVSPALIVQLRRLEIEVWPTVRDTLAINETKHFAANLQNLGQQWLCDSLVTYAQTLARHADSYSVVDLEQRLDEFSTLVSDLSKSCEHEC